MPKGKVHGRLNASWKICSLAVNGQSFLVIDGYLLNSVFFLIHFLPFFHSLFLWDFYNLRICYFYQFNVSLLYSSVHADTFCGAMEDLLEAILIGWICQERTWEKRENAMSELDRGSFVFLSSAPSLWSLTSIKTSSFSNRNSATL